MGFSKPYLESHCYFIIQNTMIKRLGTITSAYNSQNQNNYFTLTSYSFLIQYKKTTLYYRNWYQTKRLLITNRSSLHDFLIIWQILFTFPLLGILTNDNKIYMPNSTSREMQSIHRSITFEIHCHIMTHTF